MHISVWNKSWKERYMHFLSKAQNYQMLWSALCKPQPRTHKHTPPVLVSMAAELRVLICRQCTESSAPTCSHTHRDRFAVYIFNHWVRVWEQIENKELKLSVQIAGQILEKEA